MKIISKNTEKELAKVIEKIIEEAFEQGYIFARDRYRFREGYMLNRKIWIDRDELNKGDKNAKHRKTDR